MIAIVKDFDNKLFELNGIKYVRNFIAIKIGDNVRIANAYDSRFTLVVAHYTEYRVNDNTFLSSDDLVSSLSSILFVKDELQMAGPSESTNATITAIFNNVYGTWINTPNIPGSGNIVLDLTNAVNGGMAALYYKGALIDENTFTGGTIVILSGTNILNELCLVLILYDKESNGFMVNIQSGFIELPLPSEGPATMTITNIIDTSGDILAPNQMIITGIVDVDIIDPATMTITDVV